MKLSTIKDPKLRRKIVELDAVQNTKRHALRVPVNLDVQPPEAPRLNGIESDYRDFLVAQGLIVLEQSITLRLDPPFTSYRADLAVATSGLLGSTSPRLLLYECKGKHRFREKGIAKVALAAKTYPMFRFILVERDQSGWKTRVMTP